MSYTVEMSTMSCALLRLQWCLWHGCMHGLVISHFSNFLYPSSILWVSSKKKEKKAASLCPGNQWYPWFIPNNPLLCSELIVFSVLCDVVALVLRDPARQRKMLLSVTVEISCCVIKGPDYCHQVLYHISLSGFCLWDRIMCTHYSTCGLPQVFCLFLSQWRLFRGRVQCLRSICSCNWQ